MQLDLGSRGVERTAQQHIISHGQFVFCSSVSFSFCRSQAKFSCSVLNVMYYAKPSHLSCISHLSYGNLTFEADTSRTGFTIIWLEDLVSVLE